ncbi:hypothetical protein R1sor_017015 [Riccia sorocarpa]|uniref:Expansin n=1 Tax=Riccia sorocarpa TaxID=122646 RepID=A0ABD3I600_9MARC
METGSRRSCSSPAAGRLQTGLRAAFFIVSLRWIVLPATNAQSAWEVTEWTTGARATFYGGSDASGTYGGACGYGDIFAKGYGVQTTALSSALFNNGYTCGACFQLRCDSSNCYAGSSITVTATNYCPQGSFGGWCDSPQRHFDLSFPMFASLAPTVVGVIPVQYRRVSCSRTGGVRFMITGNPYWILVLIYNVAGQGDVRSADIEGTNTGWIQMNRNWGQNWQSDGPKELVGQTLSFRVSLGLGGQSKTFPAAAPASWQFGQTFEANGGLNFT